MYLRFFLTVFPGVILAGLWLLDRIVRRQKIAGAIGVGVLTAIACLINVANILPHIESAHDQKLSLKDMVDHVYAAFPRDRGHVLFVDESAGNYLDAVGGYTLYDMDLMRPTAFDTFKSRTIHQAEDDPSPLQRTRAVEYMHFVGNPLPNGEWVAKPRTQIDQMTTELVDRAFQHQRRVAFIFHGEPTQNLIPARPDLRLKKLSVSRDPPPPERIPEGLSTRWHAGARDHTPPRGPGSTWTIYELIHVDPASPL